MSRLAGIRWTAAAAALALSGCSTAPLSYHGVAPPGRETAYDCAVAELNIMGYTIEDGNRDSGFVRGRKQTSGLGTQIFVGESHHEVLTATVYDDPRTGETTLRVVASRVSDEDTSSLGGFGGGGPAEGESAIAPSDVGKGDARNLLRACGVDRVIGPVSDAEDGADGGDAP